MGLLRLFQSLRRRPLPGPTGSSLGPLVLGMRVRLRTPIASHQTVWIPAGAVGTVVGGDPVARQVSIELDVPRTVITVPRSWIEEEPALPTHPTA